MKAVKTSSGRWLVETSTGSPKFDTEQAALDFISSLGVEDAEETEDFETESSEEETSTDEQEIVCDGEGDDEEEVQSIPFSIR
jgi:hypothetical protein